MINDGNDYARLRRTVPSHLNVFGYIPGWIMSMHSAAQPHVADNLRLILRWDVAIIDRRITWPTAAMTANSSPSWGAWSPAAAKRCCC